MEAAKEPSIYMRFHVTLQKAINFVKELYGHTLHPLTNEGRFERSIKIAGLTEEIQCQDYLDYHLTWLVGLLYETLDYKPEAYETTIADILCELKDEQANRVQSYISQLTYNRKLPKGQQYQSMVNQINDMDAIPCYIMIFNLYSLCNLWKDHRMHKSKQDYEAFLSYAYIFWYRAICKHASVGKNIKLYIKNFFKQIETELGGMGLIRKKVDLVYKSL